MSVARPVVLNKRGKAAQEQLARGRSLPARLVERARIVLGAASGLQDQQIADDLAITPEKVARCAIVPCADEKRHIQALDRTQTVYRWRKAIAAR